MCNNFPNIRITEGNNFSIILPLLSRTYVATRPIDEEIDPQQLQNVVVTFGDVPYPVQLTERGVQINLPATLAVGTYNILLTAEYLGSSIRAAYESAVTIVPWSEQSTAEQYIAGSPIVLRAAYVLSGALTDAELEALKEEYREKNAQLNQAIADAEEAKREWEEKAADLDGVAQEATSQEILTAIGNIDTSDLAKEATAQAAKDAALALAPVAQAAEAYNTGKVQLAANITEKGVQASASETLPELAQKVHYISQETRVYDGEDTYGKQLFADGILWDLYQVLAEMKNRFLSVNDYAAVIVCEYYKGYDSLQLQGADGYYTCDGDYYDYASPTHVWHDADNGKMNRWVAFLYRDEGARLDITNTSISPRSMYIGGHIGTIEYFVNGCLTDLVCGVEDTDIIDNFFTYEYTQSWGNNLILNAIKNIINNNNKKRFSFSGSGALILPINESIHSTSGSFSPVVIANSANIVILKGIKNYTYENILPANAVLVRASGASYISIPDIESFGYGRNGSGLADLSNNSNIQVFSAEKINNIKLSEKLFIKAESASRLSVVVVGEMTTKLNIPTWNPTEELADAAKRANLANNIKNYILARVSDATGGTQLVFTVSVNMYNNIASEQIEWNGETMSLADAFLTKNWLLAGA